MEGVASQDSMHTVADKDTISEPPEVVGKNDLQEEMVNVNADHTSNADVSDASTMIIGHQSPPIPPPPPPPSAAADGILSSSADSAVQSLSAEKSLISTHAASKSPAKGTSVDSPSVLDYNSTECSNPVTASLEGNHPEPPGSENWIYQGEHDGYEYYRSSDKPDGQTYCVDQSGYWYIQNDDGSFTHYNGTDDNGANNSAQSLFPLNAAGQPTLPAGSSFPLDSSSMPIFPVDPMTHLPMFPVNGAGQPIFPTGPHGRPVVPVDNRGLPIFPRGADGHIIFPLEPNGKPVAPVNIYGVPVLPLDENGKAIVPYDTMGCALIHVASDGVTPLTDEEYRFSLQWNDYYEKYNPTYNHQPTDSSVQPKQAPPSESVDDHIKNLKLLKKVRPEDIDLPPTPPPSKHSASDKSSPVPQPANVEKEQNETKPVVDAALKAKTKRMLEMQLRFSKKALLSRKSLSQSEQSANTVETEKVTEEGITVSTEQSEESQTVEKSTAQNTEEGEKLSTSGVVSQRSDEQSPNSTAEKADVFSSTQTERLVDLGSNHEKELKKCGSVIKDVGTPTAEISRHSQNHENSELSITNRSKEEERLKTEHKEGDEQQTNVDEKQISKKSDSIDEQTVPLSEHSNTNDVGSECKRGKENAETPAKEQEKVAKGLHSSPQRSVRRHSDSDESRQDVRAKKSNAKRRSRSRHYRISRSRSPCNRRSTSEDRSPFREFSSDRDVRTSHAHRRSPYYRYRYRSRSHEKPLRRDRSYSHERSDSREKTYRHSRSRRHSGSHERSPYRYDENVSGNGNVSQSECYDKDESSEMICEDSYIQRHEKHKKITSESPGSSSKRRLRKRSGSIADERKESKDRKKKKKKKKRHHRRSSRRRTSERSDSEEKLIVEREVSVVVPAMEQMTEQLVESLDTETSMDVKTREKSKGSSNNEFVTDDESGYKEVSKKRRKMMDSQVNDNSCMSGGVESDPLSATSSTTLKKVASPDDVTFKVVESPVASSASNAASACRQADDSDLSVTFIGPKLDGKLETITKTETHSAIADTPNGSSPKVLLSGEIALQLVGSSSAKSTMSKKELEDGVSNIVCRKTSQQNIVDGSVATNIAESSNASATERIDKNDSLVVARDFGDSEASDPFSSVVPGLSDIVGAVQKSSELLARSHIGNHLGQSASLENPKLGITEIRKTPLEDSDRKSELLRKREQDEEDELSRLRYEALRSKTHRLMNDLRAERRRLKRERLRAVLAIKVARGFPNQAAIDEVLMVGSSDSSVSDSSDSVFPTVGVKKFENETDGISGCSSSAKVHRPKESTATVKDSEGSTRRKMNDKGTLLMVNALKKLHTVRSESLDDDDLISELRSRIGEDNPKALDMLEELRKCLAVERGELLRSSPKHVEK